jgi:hypothetical protein
MSLDRHVILRVVLAALGLISTFKLSSAILHIAHIVLRTEYVVARGILTSEKKIMCESWVV